jgi:hypothetical protein
LSSDEAGERCTFRVPSASPGLPGGGGASPWRTAGTPKAPSGRVRRCAPLGGGCELRPFLDADVWVLRPDRLGALIRDYAQVADGDRVFGTHRAFDLSSRADRARVYEVVLQEGRPADILAYVDGALVLDLWGELVHLRAVRSARAPVIQASYEVAS